MGFLFILAIEFLLLAGFYLMYGFRDISRIVSRKRNSCICLALSLFSLSFAILLNDGVIDFFAIFKFVVMILIGVGFVMGSIVFNRQQIDESLIEKLHFDGGSYSIERATYNLTGSSGYSLYYEDKCYDLGKRVPKKSSSQSISLFIYKGRVLSYAYDLHLVYTFTNALYGLCVFMFPVLLMVRSIPNGDFFRLFDVAYLFCGSLSMIMSRYQFKKRFYVLQAIISILQFAIILYFNYYLCCWILNLIRGVR